MVTYSDLCTAIVKKKINFIGHNQVIPLVRALGLKVDDDGNVEGAGKRDLEKLANELKRISGQLGVILARMAIHPLIKNETIDIPEVLK
ncbi:MAG: hypothetical protein HGA76_05795 [Candidatus Firestonebacteria bacterium]|nr:hypothetical protein [Candidatus Firestonebacteria bacterium]